MGVVGGVQHDGLPSRTYVQPAGRGHAAQGASHRVRLQRSSQHGLGGDQGAGGVVGLVRSAEPEAHVGTAAVQATHGDDLTVRDRTSFGDRKAAVQEEQPRADLVGPLLQHLEHLRRLAGAHGDRAGLDDACLLPCDVDGRRPEVVGVVERDRKDHRDLGVDDVGGVPASAHPDLDDCDVDLGLGEGQVAHGDGHLEEGERVLHRRRRRARPGLRRRATLRRTRPR